MRRRLKFCLCVVKAALLSIYLLGSAGSATGQTNVAPVAGDLSSKGPRIELLHTPPVSSELPPVGSLMRLQVALINTTDIETRIRLIGSKDGRFIDIAFPTGALNNSDKPTFTVDIPSPIAVMSYQFIIHQRDGSLTSSRKFIVKRDCIQNFAVEVPEDTSTTQFRREVASLITQAKIIERDNKSLDASLRLLEEMKASFSR